MIQTDPQHSPTEVPRAQVGQRILRATGALMLIQVIMRGFGLIEKIILGNLFGTTFVTDAYMAARDIAFYLFQIVDQVIMHSFLPVFVQRMREQGEQAAWKLASTVLNLLVLVIGGIAVLGAVFAPEILPLFVPDWFRNAGQYDPGLVPLTIQLTRMMLVAMIFLTASSLTYCLLNSYKQFALPASADLALKGTILAFAIVFAHAWGPYALALGFIIGAAAKLVVHSAGLGKKLGMYRPTVAVLDSGYRRFILLALPLLGGVLVSIVRQTMDVRFTSSLSEGSLAALRFAKNLTDVPVQTLPFVFGIALFPFLADIAVSGDRDRLRGMLMLATRMMVLIFVPLSIAVIVLREPIVMVIFGEKSQLTAVPLQIYAACMLIGALEIIVLQFYFALSETLRPTLAGIFLTPLHILIAWLGVYHLGWGVLAIPAALMIYKGTKVVVLYAMLRGRIGGLDGRATLASLGKIALALLPYSALLLGGLALLPDSDAMQAFVRQFINHEKLAKLIALIPIGLLVGSAMLAYGALLHAMKLHEIHLLLSRLRGKLRKGKPAEPPAPASA